MNDPLKMINETEYSASKWIVMGTIMVELCIIIYFLEKT